MHDHVIVQKRPIELDDLFRLKVIQDAQISPNGCFVVFAMSHIDLESEIEYCPLYLLEIESGEIKPITESYQFDSLPRWSPSGQQIAFLRHNGEFDQLHLITLDKTQSEQIVFLKNGLYGPPAWSPDGNQIAFSGIPDDRPTQARSQRLINCFDDFGSIEHRSGEIFVYDLRKRSCQQIGMKTTHDFSPQWSPRGDQLLVLSSFEPNSYNIYSQIWLLDIFGNFQQALPNWGEVFSATWHPAGNKILFIGRQNGLPEGSNKHLWLLDLNDRSLKCLSQGLRNGVAGSITYDLPVHWENCPPPIITDLEGKYAWTTVQDKGTLGIFKFWLEDHIDPIVEVSGERSCILHGVAQQKLLFSCSTMNSPSDLYILNLPTRNDLKLTDVNKDIFDKLILPEVISLEITLNNGEQCEGWYWKPILPEKAPYRTVLNIHGGPHEAYGHRFVFDFHLLCANGFGVLFLNPPGSTGYGEDYATQLFSNWGGADCDAILAMVDHTATEGLLDRARLGVTGLSYGGFMTTWLISKTKLFSAALTENPLTDWKSFFITSDIGNYFSIIQLGGTPSEIPEIYEQCSPITFSDNCETPTLLLVSEEDFRCPPNQSENFYNRIKSNNIITEIIRFPNAAHTASWNGPLEVRKAQNQSLLNWFNKYLEKYD